jgi:hypothetical protein
MQILEQLDIQCSFCESSWFLFGNSGSTYHNKNVVYILFIEKCECSSNTLLICFKELVMSLNTFLRSSKMLENITKGSERCNKCFHDFIDILHEINVCECTYVLKRRITDLIRKYSYCNTICNGKSGRFLWHHRKKFKPVLQCLHTLYWPHPNLRACLDNGIPGKLGTWYWATRSLCKGSP